MREIGKGCKDKLFLSGWQRSACEKDEMTSFQVITLSTSILIFFLFFFFSFVCLVVFFILFWFFFKNPVKINERSWLKRPALFFFLKDYFLPEKKEQPLWWLLVQHLPQQFCSCSLTAVSSAYLRVLMSECKQTNPYSTEDHHTHVLSDPHNTICSTGAAEKHTSSDLISLHSAKPTCYLTQPWQGLASLCWTLPK